MSLFPEVEKKFSVHLDKLRNARQMIHEVQQIQIELCWRVGAKDFIPKKTRQEELDGQGILPFNEIQLDSFTT